MTIKQEKGILVLDEIKYFPIMGDKRNSYKTTYIPYWLVVLGYKNYNCKSQSIERLAERGGFGREEFLKLLGVEI